MEPCICSRSQFQQFLLACSRVYGPQLGHIDPGAEHFPAITCSTGQGRAEGTNHPAPFAGAHLKSSSSPCSFCHTERPRLLPALLGRCVRGAAQGWL